MFLLVLQTAMDGDATTGPPLPDPSSDCIEATTDAGGGMKFSVFAVPSPPAPPTEKRGAAGGGEAWTAIESGNAAEPLPYSPVTFLALVVTGTRGAGSH